MAAGWQNRLMPTDSERPRYSADSLQVITLVEAVRRRPGMYFGLSRDDPKLMAAIARLAAAEPFTRSECGPVHVTLTVDSDSSFTVEDDLPPLAVTGGHPQPGIDGSLIDRRRWQLAATAAVSTHASIDVHVGGRVWRQEFAYPDWSDVIDHAPSAVVGTRAAFSLDQAYFAAGSCLPADATELAQDAAPRPVPGTLTIVDLRYGLFASVGASWRGEGLPERVGELLPGGGGDGEGWPGGVGGVPDQDQAVAAGCLHAVAAVAV
jgi:hypothetical protein